MRKLLNTLYVLSSETYLSLENDAVLVRSEERKKQRFPLHHLEALICFGHVSLSTPLMHRCAEDGKALVLLDKGGRFKARLEGPVSGNVLLRRDQYELLGDSSRAVDMARAFTVGKIRNARMLLQRGKREARDDAEKEAFSESVRILENCICRLPSCETVETVRGTEGEAGHAYFSVFSSLIKPEKRGFFAMNRRKRRPPPDAMNALLSFLYALLMNDCRSALEAVGLDPQAGLYHVLRPGRASLALDLMEEFRPIMADRLALRMVNLGQLDNGDFEVRNPFSVFLGEKGRKKVVSEWQKRKQEEVKHPLLKEKVPFGLLPLIQARLLARTVRKDAPSYLPYIGK